MRTDGGLVHLEVLRKVGADGVLPLEGMSVGLVHDDGGGDLDEALVLVGPLRHVRHQRLLALEPPQAL